MDNNLKNEFKAPSATVFFPSQSDSFEVKKTEEWGRQLGYQIRNEWFYGIGTLDNGCRNSQFNDQRMLFAERRIYAMGLQSMDKYMATFNPSGDKSFLNLPKQPITIIPKLVDVVVNGMTDRGDTIKATSIDPIGLKERVAYREQIENDKNAKDVIIAAKENFGIDIGSMPVDQLPETDDELNIHMQLEYKQSIELSTELAIETVFEENRYNDAIDKMVTKDLVVCGVGWTKNEFIPDRGVVLKYVNPENKIQSYTECPYFSDCFYHGEFKNVPLTEIFIDFQWVNAPECKSIKEQITNSGSAWYDYNYYSENDRIKGTAPLLYFTYKTTREKSRKVVEEKTGSKTVKEYQLEKNAEKNYSEKFKKVSYVEEILFEGVMVLGTDIILKWEVAENMARPKSNKQYVVEQYIGCAPNRERGFINSTVSRMMPVEDKLNVLELKASQFIQTIKTDGVAIDVTALAELDLGNGQKYTVQNAIDEYHQTGSFLYMGYGTNGDPNYNKPFAEVRTGDSLGKLQSLTGEKMHYMDLMRDVIGLNRVSDASTPDKDSLVGVQKLAALNSNLATRHILNGKSDIKKRTSEAILYRVGDLLKYSDLKEDFARKIGATSVKTLDSIKDLHLHDFAIFLELDLDDEERAKLEIDLSNAVQANMLSVSDKYKVLRVKNFDLALAYMTILIDKHTAKMQKQKIQDIEANTQSQTQIAQSAEMARKETEAMILEGKKELQAMVNEGEANKERIRGEEERETLKLKYQGEFQLKQMEVGVQNEKLKFVEDRKDDRTKLQATQQSELIDQRAKDKDPKDFQENEIEDSVFELNEP